MAGERVVVFVYVSIVLSAVVEEVLRSWYRLLSVWNRVLGLN